MKNINGILNATKRSKVVLVLTIVCISLISLTGYLFIQNQSLKDDSGSGSDSEAKEVVAKVGEIFAIDSSSKPTVARIDDPEKLQASNKTFYKNVVRGDYLIVYPNRALLYRPSDHKIVNVADIVGDKTEQ